MGHPIYPICLPRQDESFDEAKATIAGKKLSFCLCNTMCQGTVSVAQ